MSWPSTTLAFCSLSASGVVTGTSPGGMDCIWDLSATSHVWKLVLIIVVQRLMYFKQSIKNLHTHCIFRVVHDHECIMEPGGNYFQWNNLRKYMEKGCIFPKVSDIIKSFKAGHFLELMTFFLVLFSWLDFLTTDESPQFCLSYFFLLSFSLLYLYFPLTDSMMKSKELFTTNKV